MVIKLTLTVRQVLLSCIIPMVVRCITQGYMKATVIYLHGIKGTLYIKHALHLNCLISN